MAITLPGSFVKRVVYMGALLVVFSAFAWASDVSAAECQVSMKPEVVASGGKLWSDADNILARDNKAALLGSQGSEMGDASSPRPVGGWAVIDFGCFLDHEGEDVEVFEIGDFEGGEIYVGRVGASLPTSPTARGAPGVSGWSRIEESVPPHHQALYIDCGGRDPELVDPSTCSAVKNPRQPNFSCDGSETLPEEAEACPVRQGVESFALDIGGNDNTMYQYVYVWSDGSPTGEQSHGGSSDIDAIEIVPPSTYADLRGKTISGEYKDVLYSLLLGDIVYFEIKANAPGERLSYSFKCNESNASAIEGELSRRDDGLFAVDDLSCEYASSGIKTARVDIVDEFGSASSDRVEVRLSNSDSSRTVVAGEGGTGGPDPRAYLYLSWAILLVLAYYAVRRLK